MTTDGPPNEPTGPEVSPPDENGTVRSRLTARGADVIQVTVRELRLLLGVLLILFMTSETWRYIGQLPVLRLLVFVVATVGAALLVVWLGLRRTLDSRIHPATVRVITEVLAFTALLFVTFVGVGFLSVDAGLVAEWSGHDADVLFSMGLADPPLVLTRQLLQLAAFLSSLGSLVFAVEVVTDADTRRILLQDLVGTDGDEPGRINRPGNR